MELRESAYSLWRATIVYFGLFSSKEQTSGRSRKPYYRFPLRCPYRSPDSTLASSLTQDCLPRTTGKRIRRGGITLLTIVPLFREGPTRSVVIHEKKERENKRMFRAALSLTLIPLTVSVSRRAEPWRRLFPADHELGGEVSVREPRVESLDSRCSPCPTRLLVYSRVTAHPWLQQ